MSVETDIQNTTSTTDVSAGGSQSSPAAASNEEQGGGIRRGRSSEFLGKVDFTPPAKQPNAAEPVAPDDRTSEVEATDGKSEAEPPEVTQAPPNTDQGEDEVSRLKRENEAYQRQFQELESARQAAEVQHLTRTQQEELQNLTNRQARAETAYARKYHQVESVLAEWQQAKAERDIDTVEAIEESLEGLQEELYALYDAQTTAQESVQRKTREFAENYDRTRQDAQSAAIERVVKQYGLTLKELKDHAPDLKVTEYFKVLETTAKAIATSKDKEIATLKQQLKEQETRLRAEFRDQFDNSPGAIPHRSNGGTAGAHVDGIRAGNSSKLLEKAFKNL